MVDGLVFGGNDSVDDVRRAESLRTGLSEYELFDEDLDLLEGGSDVLGDVSKDPVVAIVGRPNVGKSSLVNRIVGARLAVVEDVPGVTRDRVSYPASWGGCSFVLTDTGGWEVDAVGFYVQVARQAQVAVELSDLVLFVVDANVGVADGDAEMVDMLRKSGKKIVVVANKVDGLSAESDAAFLWSLGLGEPFCVSALHGRGVADLLDRVVSLLPEKSEVVVDFGGELARRVALAGRPNVGKSSLLNRLAGVERVVVDSMSGTTRDPVDELVELDGRVWCFVDTAGIRRRVHLQQGADFYASLRTKLAIEKAEVVVVLLEASEVVSEQDVRILQFVLDAGRALVLGFNKWDLVDEDRRKFLEREVERDLAHVSWAPRVNFSAQTGWHVGKLTSALDMALESWSFRVPTGRLNVFFAELAAANPHPVRGGKQPRILFVTQAGVCPPKFVIFTTGFFDPGYRRFIVRRLRETFGFEGSPIEVSVRVREKRRR